MPVWKHEIQNNENNQSIRVNLPLIVSASRATDIPAFFGDDFEKKIKGEIVERINPFNRKTSYISLHNTRFVVFWSKNYRPFFEKFKLLNERNINFYCQFTLNDYEQEGYEIGVPKLSERIETYKRLVDLLKNPEQVVWRFDPLILSENVDEKLLAERIVGISEKLADYAKNLVISFADIETYPRVRNNMRSHGFLYREWTNESMKRFASELTKNHPIEKLKISTCAESIHLSEHGIEHAKCIDDVRIRLLSPNDEVLMKFLGVKNGNHLALQSHKSLKDKAQRKDCACIVSADIGKYNTCRFDCAYCYAKR